MFQYWSQNTNPRVDLDLDYKTPSKDAERVAPYLELRVENLRHGVTLNFGERSRGFQWFFSFLAGFSEYRDVEGDYILLLDEPGLGLHASAQEDFLPYIDQDLARNHQVIYTTHSPFMVQPTEVERVRLVEDKDKLGTTVSNEPLGVSRDTAFPIQAALGYSLSQSLFLGPDNLIVESPSDLLYLTAISEHLRDAGRAHLHDRWVIVPIGGLEKVPSFIALLGAQLNVAVVVDGAAGGTHRLQDMIDKRVIEADRVLPLTAMTGGKEADIEDLFTESFYVELLNASGALANVRPRALPKGNRIAARVAKHLGLKRYDHYRPRRTSPAIKRAGYPSSTRPPCSASSTSSARSIRSFRSAASGSPERATRLLFVHHGVVGTSGGARASQLVPARRMSRHVVLALPAELGQLPHRLPKGARGSAQSALGGRPRADRG